MHGLLWVWQSLQGEPWQHWSKVLVSPTLATLETVELHRFEPWICVVYRPDKQRTLFGFALGLALAETVGPVRAVSFVVGLWVVQTCYFHQRPAPVNRE